MLCRSICAVQIRETKNTFGVDNVERRKVVETFAFDAQRDVSSYLLSLCLLDLLNTPLFDERIGFTKCQTRMTMTFRYVCMSQDKLAAFFASFMLWFFDNFSQYVDADLDNIDEHLNDDNDNDSDDDNDDKKRHDTKNKHSKHKSLSTHSTTADGDSKRRRRGSASAYDDDNAATDDVDDVDASAQSHAKSRFSLFNFRKKRSLKRIDSNVTVAVRNVDF